MKTASLGLLEVMVVRVNARSVLCMVYDDVNCIALDYVRSLQIPTIY